MKKIIFTVLIFLLIIFSSNVNFIFADDDVIEQFIEEIPNEKTFEEAIFAEDEDDVIEQFIEEIPNEKTFREAIEDIRVVRDNNNRITHIEVAVHKQYHSNRNRIVIQVDGTTLTEAYQGIVFNGTVMGGRDTNTLRIPYNKKDINEVRVILSSGLPNGILNTLEQITKKIQPFKEAIKNIIVTGGPDGVITTIDVEIDKRFQEEKNRIMVEVNGQYLAESYEGVTYNAGLIKGNDVNILRITNLNISGTAEIKVSLLAGMPNQEYNILDYITKTILSFKDAIKDIRVKENNDGTINQIEVEIDKEYQEQANRIIVDINQEYLAESYRGEVYHSTLVRGTNTNTLVISNKNFPGISEIRVRLSSGMPNQSSDILHYVTKNIITFKAAIKDIRVIEGDNGQISEIEVEIYKPYQEGNNRIMIDLNGSYKAESYEGRAYYSRLTKGTDTNTLKIHSLNLTGTNEVRVRLSSGYPSGPSNVLDHITVKFYQINIDVTGNDGKEIQEPLIFVNGVQTSHKKDSNGRLTLGYMFSGKTGSHKIMAFKDGFTPNTYNLNLTPNSSTETVKITLNSINNPFVSTIHGLVMDNKTKEVLSNCVVLIGTVTFLTDINGHFLINLPSGHYNVTVYRDNYMPLLDYVDMSEIKTYTKIYEVNSFL